MISWMFWNSSTENFGKLPKVVFHFNRNARIQSKLHCTKGTSWQCSEKKGCSQIPQKSLRNCRFISNATTLQSRISDFSKYRLQGKCFFFFEYSEIVGSLPEKVSVIKWFDWLNASKKYHYTFLRGWWKNCCHKIFGKLSRNVFSSVPCRKFELPNPSTTTTSKTDSTACVSFVCSANFRNCWGSIVESSFRKEKKLLRFATVPRNTCMVCSEK